MEEARRLAAGWTVCAEGGGRLRRQDIPKPPVSEHLPCCQRCLQWRIQVQVMRECVYVCVWQAHLPSEYKEFELNFFGPREKSFSLHLI